MALQLETYLSGRMNNVVFFKRGDVYMARSLPDTVKLSAATKVCNGNFGLASTCGKKLREQLPPVLPFPKDRIMQVRFSGAINKWIKSGNAPQLQPTPAIPFVQGYQFNRDTCIAERCKLPISIQQPLAGLIQVRIPAFIPAASIAAPAHTLSVDCTITTAGCLLEAGSPTGSHTVNITIPYNDSQINEQVIDLPVPAPAGTVLVTVMALRYRLADGNYCSKRAFLPASVIDARYC